MEAYSLTELIAAFQGTLPDVKLHPMVEMLNTISIFSAVIIGYIGVSIMLYGSIIAMVRFVQGSVFGKLRLSMVRIELGKHLALGLEFLVGKDIIESIVHPTWDDLGKLGAIIALRTIVTVFLSRELKEVEQEIVIEREEIEVRNMSEKSKQRS